MRYVQQSSLLKRTTLQQDRNHILERMGKENPEILEDY